MAIITPTYSVTQLKGFQTNLFGTSNNEIDIHMSDLDEETKRLLAEVENEVSPASSSKDKTKDKKEHKNDDYNEYEDDDRDPLEHKDMDDREW